MDLKKSAKNFARVVTLVAALGSAYWVGLTSRPSWEELPPKVQQSVEAQYTETSALLQRAVEDFKKGNVKSAGRSCKYARKVVKGLAKIDTSFNQLESFIGMFEVVLRDSVSRAEGLENLKRNIGLENLRRSISIAEGKSQQILDLMEVIIARYRFEEFTLLEMNNELGRELAKEVIKEKLEYLEQIKVIIERYLIARSRMNDFLSLEMYFQKIDRYIAELLDIKTKHKLF